MIWNDRSISQGKQKLESRTINKMSECSISVKYIKLIPIRSVYGISTLRKVKGNDGKGDFLRFSRVFHL
jgi:hypothetical protein